MILLDVNGFTMYYQTLQSLKQQAEQVERDHSIEASLE